MEYRMMLNIERLECSECHGTFVTGETVIEENDSSYCEVCFDEKQETE